MNMMTGFHVDIAHVAVVNVSEKQIKKEEKRNELQSF
jgi:hypothetical protein